MTTLPADTTERIRSQAKLQDLTWVAEQLVACHDRYVKRTSKFSQCLCSLCRHARPWVVSAPEPDTGTTEPREGYMTGPPWPTEKCPHCWAYFTKGLNHQCPPFLVALVKLHNEKKNTIEPLEDA